MHKVDLVDGIKVGEKKYTTIYLVELDAGGAMDAAMASERIQLTNTGEPVIVNSPTLATAERNRRQIRRLEGVDGEMQGPLSLKDLRSFSDGDYQKITAEIDVVDALYAQRAAGGENTERFQQSEAGSNTDAETS